MNSELVYIGKIIDLEPIVGADFILSATVICGKGGRWRGIVKKDDFSFGDECLVFLSDSLLPQTDEYRFMEKHKWRVKMMRFKGAASECLIMPCYNTFSLALGTDVTKQIGVTKYIKPMPAHLNGIAIGNFPNFIPKTDEVNWQADACAVENLVGKPYYITEKCDGSSTTAYRYKRHFGVCSRNLELEPNEENGYWKVARKYNLENLIPEGFAIQWETCGPGIQSNPMSLSEIDGFIFNINNINEHRYLDFNELHHFLKDNNIKMPTVKVLQMGNLFNNENIAILGEGEYENGKQREGVVVRSMKNYGHSPISFKVINLNYEN